MNVISFSLFGNIEIYLCGAVENSKIYKDIYPGFTARFYVDKNININVKKDLLKSGCEVIEKKTPRKWEGLFWRFEPIMDKNVKLWISRDCDSRLNSREASAVNEWISSNRTLHVMRDSANHSFPIMAGMFGINNSKVSLQHRVKFIRAFKKPKFKVSDQDFLTRTFWKWFLSDSVIHDHWFFNLPNYKIEKHEDDNITPEDAYGCGLISYIVKERILRHSDIFPQVSLIKPFPASVNDYPYYVGAQFDCRNNLISSTDSRWELQLRK